MEKIVWNQSLSVGVEEIDRQHKQLVFILNQLLGMDGLTVDSETISDTLTRMTDYADYHFNSEEGYMRKYAYPDYERAEAQEIDLEEVHGLDVCLVPLDDGAVFHRGILDGNDGI